MNMFYRMLYMIIPKKFFSRCSFSPATTVSDGSGGAGKIIITKLG